MQLKPDSQQVMSVGQLTSGIKMLLEDSFQAIWVRGEVSNIRYQSSGHVYFSLKDDRAQISAVIFKGVASKLPFKIRDGLELVALGNVSVYEPRGNYQLIIRHCIEEGAGRLQAEFERLKQQISAEGLFDRERKQAIPQLPGTVGFITSPTGAALRDFVSILRRRNWCGRVIVFPCIVQGKEGGSDILRNLADAEAIGSIDLLVLGRGGGSLEDLWNFNEESVVRAVAASSIPTISAVGHEIDFVLTDFAADRRAETPSAAAELISSQYVEAVTKLERLCESLQKLIQIEFVQKGRRLELFSQRLKGVAPMRVLENRHLRLDELHERMVAKMHVSMQLKGNKMDMLDQQLKRFHPKAKLQEFRERTDRLEDQLLKESSHVLALLDQRLEGLNKRLLSLSVDQVLKRGFTITRDGKGEILTSQRKVADASMIETQFKDGRLSSVVRKKKQMDLFDGSEN